MQTVQEITAKLLHTSLGFLVKRTYRDCQETPELYAFVEKQLSQEDLGPRVQILANSLVVCVCVLGHCGWDRLRSTELTTLFSSWYLAFVAQ
jgi:hypothetical protein